MQGVRAWGPVTNPTARALASWLCAFRVRHEGARGGGTPLAWVWGVRGWALSHPQPPVLSGVRRGPTTHWLWLRGVRAWGPVTDPTTRALASWLCALWGRPEGARGGASCLGVGRPGSGALPPPTTRPFGRAAGARYPLAVGAGGAGVGTRHQLHSARSCELAVRAVGAAQGRPGGAPLAWVWGVRGRALSHPRPLILAGVRPGPTTHWLWVQGVRAWGPVTNPTTRALASWLCALWGRHEGARGGAPLAWVWGVRGRPLSPPRPLVFSGVRPGPTTHWLWLLGERAWGPVTNPTARALASWLCALWGRHKGSWGGAPLAGVWGVRGRALPHPRPLVPSGVGSGPTTLWLWVRCADRVARVSLAPFPAPRFVLCRARFPGLRQPVAIVDWHLSLCHGGGRRRASLACLVAPRLCAAPRPVRSLSVLMSAFPSL